MGVTPVFGFPYPAGSDPNDIPADMQALADAIDTFLSLLPRGEIGRFESAAPQLIANTAGDFNSVLTKTLTIPAGRKVEVRVEFEASGSVAGDTYQYRIRQAGAIIQDRNATIPAANASVPVAFSCLATASGLLTYLVTVSRPSGTGTGGWGADASNKAKLVFTDLGPA